MRKIFLALITACGLSAVNAQTGMIAHWDMNGTTTDVSGNGNSGHGHNLTPAVGMDGVMGHAWYFNGANSSITIPYSPALNVSNFSIATVIQISGFYSGNCHGNILFTRGRAAPGGTGTYYFQFTDEPAGYGCTPAIDSTKESFMGSSCASGTCLTPSSDALFDYTPHVAKDQWYTAVITFNDTVYKVYVNGMLRVTVPITSPGVHIGTSTDSASIGYAVYDAGLGYPYGFKGIMDDMKLFNTALTDSQVVHLNDTCGGITLQPASVTAPAAGTVVYSVTATVPGAVYQWQQNAGTGFTNLANAGPYSGVNTNSLTVTGVTPAMNAYGYRCVLSNPWGCADTSSTAVLTLGVNDVDLNTITSVYPNPVHSKLTIVATNTITDVAVSNMLGQIMYTAKPDKDAVQLDLSGLANGIYFVRINGSDVRKFIKE